MRLKYKIVAITFTILLCILISGKILLTSNWFREYIKTWIITALEKRLNSEVKVEKISGNLFTNIKLTKIEIIGPKMRNNHKCPLNKLVAEEVFVTFNPLDFLFIKNKKKLNFIRVNIAKPKVHLYLTETEKNKWENFFQEKTDQKKEGGFSITLLTVKDANIYLIQTERSYAIENLFLKGSIVYSKPNWGIHVRQARGLFQNNQIEQIKGSLYLKPEKIEVKNFAVSSNELTGIASGSVEKYKNTWDDLILNLRIRFTKIEIEKVINAIPFLANSLSKSITGTAEITADLKGKISCIEGIGTLKIAKGTFLNIPFKNFILKLASKEGYINFETEKVRIGSSGWLLLNGNLNFAKAAELQAPVFEISFKIDNIDLQEKSSSIKNELSGRLTANFTLTGILNKPESYQGSGVLRISDGKYDIFSKLCGEITLAIEKQNLNIQKIYLWGEGIKLTGNGPLILDWRNKKKVSISGSFLFENGKLQQVQFSQAKGTISPDGKISLTLNKLSYGNEVLGDGHLLLFYLPEKKQFQILNYTLKKEKDTEINGSGFISGSDLDITFRGKSENIQNLPFISKQFPLPIFFQNTIYFAGDIKEKFLNPSLNLLIALTPTGITNKEQANLCLSKKEQKWSFKGNLEGFNFYGTVERKQKSAEPLINLVLASDTGNIRTLLRWLNIDTDTDHNYSATIAGEIKVNGHLNNLTFSGDFKSLILLFGPPNKRVLNFALKNTILSGQWNSETKSAEFNFSAVPYNLEGLNEKKISATLLSEFKDPRVTKINFSAEVNPYDPEADGKTKIKGIFLVHKGTRAPLTYWLTTKTEKMPLKEFFNLTTIYKKLHNNPLPEGTLDLDLSLKGEGFLIHNLEGKGFVKINDLKVGSENFVVANIFDGDLFSEIELAKGKIIFQSGEIKNEVNNKRITFSGTVDLNSLALDVKMKGNASSFNLPSAYKAETIEFDVHLFPNLKDLQIESKLLISSGKLKDIAFEKGKAIYKLKDKTHEIYGFSAEDIKTATFGFDICSIEAEKKENIIKITKAFVKNKSGIIGGNGTINIKNGEINLFFKGERANNSTPLNFELVGNCIGNYKKREGKIKIEKFLISDKKNKLENATDLTFNWNANQISIESAKLVSNSQGQLKVWGTLFVNDNLQLSTCLVNLDGKKLTWSTPDNTIEALFNCDLKLSYFSNTEQPLISGIFNFGKLSVVTGSKKIKVEKKERDTIFGKIKKWNPELQFDITFAADSQIYFKNELLNLEGKGKLHFSGTLENRKIEYDFKTLSGYAVFRNRKFNIIKGDLIQIDPMFVNPYLEVLAETRIREFNIFLKLNGFLDDYSISLYAEPPLEEIDIIALIATGKTLAELKDLDRKAQSAEVAFSYIANQLLSSIESQIPDKSPISRVRVEYNSENEPTLILEKDLGKKATAAYKREISKKSDSEIRLEYQMNPYLWAIGSLGISEISKKTEGAVDFELKLPARLREKQEN